MGALSFFSSFVLFSLFTKGKNCCDFLFVLPDVKILLNVGLLFNENFFRMEVQILSFYDLTTTEKGDKNQNGRFASVESIPIYLQNCSIFRNALDAML